MKWLRRILGFLLVIVIFFLGVGFALPRGYHVERATVIEAPSSEIHAWVEDLRRWEQWSPWKEADPTLEVTIGELAAGQGAHQSWVGKSGSGELTIVSSDPSWGIEYEMSFDEGRFRSRGSLSYEPAPTGTRVVWTMDGKMSSNPIERWFGLFMDYLVGRDFVRGLENLKSSVESAS